MLVDGKQKIAHQLVLFVHQHLFISPLLFVSPEIAWKPPILEGQTFKCLYADDSWHRVFVVGVVVAMLLFIYVPF